MLAGFIFIQEFPEFFPFHKLHFAFVGFSCENQMLSLSSKRDPVWVMSNEGYPVLKKFHSDNPYFSQPIVLGSTRGGDPHLQPPARDKQFLISPPASPPVGWEPIEEAEPIVNYDLISAVANLAPGGSIGGLLKVHFIIAALCVKLKHQQIINVMIWLC